jgi:hypothetical protein
MLQLQREMLADRKRRPAAADRRKTRCAMKMSKGNSFRIVVAGVIVSLLFFGATTSGWSQSGGGNGGASGQQPGSGMPLPPPPSTRSSPPRTPIDINDPDDVKKLEEQQATSRNAERQKRLQMDTEKLLALATELKEQVDKTDKNTLSLDVIKKADEIEKLAKSVKDRMKG